MKTYIGIDPGVKTGFAVSRGGELVEVRTLKLHEALRLVADYHASCGDALHVVFEDARQRKWLERERSVSEYRGRLMGAGSVKRDCTIWEEFLTAEGIAYTAKAPAKGATKWSEAQFVRMTGYKGRTSNHGRDAALLVFGR